MKAIYIVCMIALISAIMVTPAMADTITVCSSGCDYTSIRDAVAAANDGDTVFVYNGSYSDPAFCIDKPNITLRGEGADVVTWAGAGSFDWVFIGDAATPAPGCVVEGIKIVNSLKGVTIGPGSPNCIIRNCIFEGLTDVNNGILISAVNTTFMNNVVSDSLPAYGVVQLYADSCVLVNNTFIDNSGAALYLYLTPNSIIARNNFSSNGDIIVYDPGEGIKWYLNNFIGTSIGAPWGEPDVMVWNSTEPIEYTYGGNTYTNYLGNYWSDYTGSNAGEGIGDVPYMVPDGLGSDFRPLVAPFEDYLGDVPADLTPTEITPNCGGYLFDGNNNEVCALIENLGGAASAFSVRFDINGDIQEVAVTGLPAGENTTVCVTDSTSRTVGDTVAITVTADCDDEVTEGNETNNVLSGSETVVNNGYKGKRYTGGDDIATHRMFDLHGNLVYSVGDSEYMSGSTGWTDMNVAWTASDLSVPATATIKEARLYVPYTYAKDGAMPDNYDMTFNDCPVEYDAHYWDDKTRAYGTNYAYYGMLVYDVTAGFSKSGNTANFTSLWSGLPTHSGASMRGMLLTVVYADDSEPERVIYLNEEFDMLYGSSSKCTTPAEATAYAPFSGHAIDLGRVANATLITVAPGAGAPYYPDEGELLFNTQTWTNVWNQAGNTQMGIDERDVSDWLQSTGNEAGFQSSADWMEASNAILIVEAVPSVKTATGSGTATFESNAGTIVKLTAIAELAMPGGKPDLMFPHGFFSFEITDLTPGQTVEVTVTLPADVPEGTQYWKYHGGWVQIPIGDDDGDNVITIQLTDGGLGDSDELEDGTIVDPGAPGVTNLIYLSPDNSVSTVSPVQVDVYTYINATNQASGSQFDIEYDPSCIHDFPSFDDTGSDWVASGATVTCTNPSSGILRFTTFMGLNPAISGNVKVGTLTFTCNTSCGGSSLDFTNAKYATPSGTLFPAVDNGTFLCGDVINVTKKVWDGSAWMDAIEPLGPELIGQDVRFNITVTSGCLDLSDVVVNDIMSDSLEYNNSADPADDSNTTHTADWTLGSIDAGTSKSIEFNATIVDYGISINTATATATVTSLGFDVTDTASLIVKVGETEMSAKPDSDDCYNVGEQFDVLVNITPMGKSIMGAQFDLHFNASVLQAETVTYGNFLTQDGWTNIFVADSGIDNLNGIVSFAAARQGTDIGVTTPGTFAIVHFTAMTQGGYSELNLTGAMASTDSIPVKTIDVDTDNGTAEVCSNLAPTAKAKSDFMYNNIAEKGLSKAYFNGTESYDTEGEITYWRWWVDDGSSIVGESAVHLFEVPKYWSGDQTGSYVPANVTLTVTDDGMPLTDGSDSINVTVWIAGDATGDGRVNIADAVTFGMQFGATCEIGPDGLRWDNNPEGDKADLNNDKRVNIGDAMLLGTCWGHTAW